MRKTFVKGLTDRSSYDFGADVSIVCAVMDLCKKHGCYGDGITYSVNIDGKELKEFIINSCPTHDGVLSDIHDDFIYELTAWDW